MHHLHVRRAFCSCLQGCAEKQLICRDVLQARRCSCFHGNEPDFRSSCVEAEFKAKKKKGKLRAARLQAALRHPSFVQLTTRLTTATIYHLPVTRASASPLSSWTPAALSSESLLPVLISQTDTQNLNPTRFLLTSPSRNQGAASLFLYL